MDKENELKHELEDKEDAIQKLKNKVEELK